MILRLNYNLSGVLPVYKVFMVPDENFIGDISNFFTGNYCLLSDLCNFDEIKYENLIRHKKKNKILKLLVIKFGLNTTLGELNYYRLMIH